MNWLSPTLGILLGLGVLLGWRGLRAVTDKSNEGEGRRKGMWQLNGGILLIVASAVGITWIAPK